MQRQTLVLALLSLAAAACQSPQRESAPPDFPPIEASELGTMHNVVVSEGLWFGGRPSLADLDLAKRRGIGRVIDLCLASETEGLDLRGESSRLGLEWLEVWLEGDEIPDESVDQVITALGLDDGVRTLMYCGDGSRSAMFFAIHRVVNIGMPVEAALVEARGAGMHPGAAEAFVRDQVERLRDAGSR